MPSTINTSRNQRKIRHRARWKARWFPLPIRPNHRWNVCAGAGAVGFERSLCASPPGERNCEDNRRAQAAVEPGADHGDARAGYNGSEAEKKFTLRGEAYVEAVRGFFRERLEFYLRDVLGLAYDVVNATLAAGADDVVDAVARAEAVAKVRPSSGF